MQQGMNHLHTSPAPSLRVPIISFPVPHPSTVSLSRLKLRLTPYPLFSLVTGADHPNKKGKRAHHRPKEDLPKPTKALEARSEDLGIDKNLGKTVLVQTTTTGKGPRGAGFYVCPNSPPLWRYGLTNMFCMLMLDLVESV